MFGITESAFRGHFIGTYPKIIYDKTNSQSPSTT